MAIVPVPPIILLALPNVSKPPYVAPVALLLMIAPLLEMPVPLTVSASAVPRVNPLRSKTAPSVIDVFPTVVPSGVLVPSPVAPSLRVPALIVVVPV